MHKVKVGLVGSGFAATLHMEAYRQVYGIEPYIAAVASTSAGREAFAEKYGIPSVYGSMEEMIEAEHPDIVDICTPPSSHETLVAAAMKAGCHVICEKPLTGWFADKDEPEMLEQVVKQMDDLREVIRESGKKFFYAENFVYAPSVQKSASLLRATKDRVLFMRGEESHSGSHAGHAALWSMNGGGSLIRQGCHPLSALLYLKQQEGSGNGAVKSVIADMGYIVPSLNEDERKNINARPKDVEDLANVIMTFEDGTKASVVSGDMILGGVRNEIQVYTTGGVHQCRIAPNDQMQVYHVDESRLKDEYFTEKVETKQGWQSIFLDEDVARGYVGELRDFLLCAAGEKEEPESGFELAYETVRIIYGAYQSARDGRRILF
jgi:predicted dehydrogenase